MRQKIYHTFKLPLGIAISLLFLYLAFRKVNLKQLLEAFRNTDYVILSLAVFVLFLSHWFRALRHRYLLESIKPIKTLSLFSALMICYMANAILPAHLGEFFRAYIIGKKESVSGSSAFATIVVERVIDVLTLILIMGLMFTVYPFPKIVKLSACLTFAFAIAIALILTLLKFKPEPAVRFIEIITKPLPNSIIHKLINMTNSFTEGMVALKNIHSYIIFGILSIIIWGCYTAVLAIGFYALDFVELYNLPISASIVVLIMTTVAILVPSSPGYIGTYHWSAMFALSLFGVPESPALLYAIIIHAISGIPVALVGAAFAFKEGVSISKLKEHQVLKEMAVS